MKQWIILSALSIGCALLIPLLPVDVTTDRQIIYIKGGEPVLADHVSRSDQFVFYEIDGKSGMFMRDDVSSVGSIQVQRKVPLLTLINRYKIAILSSVGVSRTIIHATDGRLLLFLIVLVLFWGLWAAAARTIGRVRNQRARPLDRGASTPAGDQPSVVMAEGEDVSDLRNIAMFFLELYKLQNGLKKDAPARFAMAAESAHKKMKVFELGVKGSTDWLTRRMSVGPLGEETGSKSKCFYVIYDTHMVIKIPPVPVTDIEKYIGDIRREVQIVANLAPIACIVPMVSVVLNKVKKLPYKSSLNQEQLEKRYIRLVEEAPEYQEYLKIGDQFAFFMELSNSFFLGRVIDDLHQAKGNIGRELRDAPEVAWDQEAFTARYGLESLTVFEELQTLYQLCDTAARRVIAETGQDDSIHTFQIKNWFLASIAGEDITNEEDDLSPSLLSRIKDEFATVFKSNQKNINDLVRLLKNQIEVKGFMQSRQQIENIASNMLQLLCQLKAKRIALRDLKPDNLFLDADPDDYPVCLNSETGFSIGVIDVETAATLTPAKDGTIAQPLLGGTPLYATPLHLYKNQTLVSFFGELSDSLHLQDWFATMAIIFKAITGKNLFPRAARSFPEILKILKSSRSKSDPDEATVKAMSQKYWSAATIDFKTNLSAYADALNQLTLSLPEAMAPTIAEELGRERACLDSAVRKHVHLSPLFKSEKNRTFLLNASSDTLAKQVARWSNTSQLPDQHRQMAPQMVAFLKNLNRLKKGLAEKQRALSAFDHPVQRISAHSLLEAMFQIAFRNMYKSRWKALPKIKAVSDRQAAVKDDQSMVTAVLNDS
jgi:serine/threonine protein kinase